MWTFVDRAFELVTFFSMIVFWSLTIYGVIKEVRKTK